VLDLTAAGEEFLRQAASPEALAATGVGHKNSLRQSLEADRQQLQQTALAAMHDPGKRPAGKVQKDRPPRRRALCFPSVW
jgi:hypothetical protein